MKIQHRFLIGSVLLPLMILGCNVFNNPKLIEQISIESKFITGTDVRVMDQFFSTKTNTATGDSNPSSIYLLTKCSPIGVPRKRILNLKVEFTSPKLLKGIQIEIIPWSGGFLKGDSTYALNKVVTQDEILTDNDRRDLLNASPTFKVVELSAK